MATFRKRNGKWQVQVRKAGSGSVSKTFTKKPDAIRWANQEEHLREAGNLPLGRLDRDKHTLHELLERYALEVLPRKRAPEPERYVLRALQRSWLARKALRDIGPHDFAKFRDERLRDVAASTVRRQFNVLRHALKIAKTEWQWSVPYEFLCRIKLPEPVHFHVARVNEQQVNSLLRATEMQSNGEIGFAVRMALYTGMRRGELLNLNWTDVDLKVGTIQIRTSKNGRPRLIPIASEALIVLASRPLKSGPLFSISANCLRLAFERAKRKAGLDVRFHDLRHEAISRLFEAGFTVPEVQMISGHRTMSQLARYSHPEFARVLARFRQDAPYQN